jgi:hypothetical protein
MKRERAGRENKEASGSGFSIFTISSYGKLLTAKLMEKLVLNWG